MRLPSMTVNRIRLSYGARRTMGKDRQQENPATWAGCVFAVWLGRQDSNLDDEIQNLGSYH